MAKKSLEVDTRFPKMFSDEPVPVKLGNAKLITDLKNLGPSSQAEFYKAGIKTADQFIKMGWKKTFKKLSEVNPKNRHPIFAYALIGALKDLQWNRIPEQDKAEAREFSQSLKPSKKKKVTSKKAKTQKRK